MTRKGTQRFRALRERAEARLQDMPRRLEDARPGDIRALIHDLQVHQIELEIQNEELRNVQSELEQSRDAYAQLFDEAPVGYLIIDSSGSIQQANTTFAEMPGVSLASLGQRRFVRLLEEADHRVFLSRFNALFKNPAGKTLVVRIKRGDGGAFWACVQARPRRLSARAASPESSHDLLP